MKLHEARTALKDKNITLHHHDGEYRVNHKAGKEPTAYYTDDLDDAVKTGHHMAQHADLLNAKANILKEERLATKADRLQKIGQEAARLEGGRTQDALGKLGAGKGYGE